MKAIKAKESGKHLSQTLGTPVTTAKITSNLPPGSRCGNCGKTGHTSQREDCEKNLPAWDKICLTFERKGHFRGVCRMKKKLVAGQQKQLCEMPAVEDNLEVVSSQMSVNLEEIATVRGINKAKIPHMI